MLAANKFMKIFFQANSNVQDDLKQRYQQMINLLETNGVNYYSNLLPEEIAKADIFIFNQIDAIIIEGTKLNSEANYILALALSQKKPILFLVNRGTIIEEEIKKLTKDKKLANFFYFYYYNEKNLVKIISSFIDLLGASEAEREVPSIKFTLRLTPRMERYLSWKITNTKKKKADYLRVVLNQLIDNDQDYINYIKREK